MTEQHYKVMVQEDYLERIANARPIQAIAELIWNGLDADATDVNVEVKSTKLGMERVTVHDNGHGISYEEAPELFSKLGGSWKIRNCRSRERGRMLHGKEAKGRFKALVLGRVGDWKVKFKKNGEVFSYAITLIKDNLVDVRITDTSKAKGDSGVEVIVTELHRDFHSLEEKSAVQELSEIFAIYLTDYEDVKISFCGQKLDPASSISSRKGFKLKKIEENGLNHEVTLEIIEWKTATERIFYLCNENGFPLQRLDPRFHTPGFQFSAYLKSNYVTKLHERGLLDLAEMDPSLMEAYESAQDQIKSYFKERETERSKSYIEQWKEEKVYPYTEEPNTSVEKVERKVFDIVALNINRHLPDFATADRRSKAFQLRMLRQAIERGPEELRTILIEVLDLPLRKQKELANLLEDTTLSNFISASKLVTDRLKFLNGLETLIFDTDLKKLLKERSQLHRLLADNTWVFGEEFNLTVDDQSLSEVLRKHLESQSREIVIDKSVTKVDGSKGIIDLMLSRSVPRNHSDEKEHLIVELKAPTVRIGAKEITQTEQYAFGISGDERFRSLNTRWNFWVISNDFDKYGEQKAHQTNRPPGLIHQADEGNVRISIWIKTWSELLTECNVRMRFFKDQLEINIDRTSSLKYLQETYDKYLSGVFEAEEKENGNDEK